MAKEKRMKRIRISFIALCLLVAGQAAWAQLALGGTGAIYANSDQSAHSVISRFKEGEGIFYGPFIEFGARNVALGGAFNWSTYYADVGGWKRMIDYDLNGYLQAHMFGYRSFLDPFLEGGFGLMASDYADSAEDPDEDNPIRATKYFQAGGGFGLNFGDLEFFFKTLYMVPMGSSVMAEDSFGNEIYPLDAYPLKPMKVFAGFKLIL